MASDDQYLPYEERKSEYRDIKSLNQSYSGLGKISTITNPIFICVISYTRTSEIPGITMAGANAELLKFTSEQIQNFFIMDVVNALIKFQLLLMESRPPPLSLEVRCN